MSLIGLLIAVIVIVVILWLVAQLPIDAKIKNIITVIVILIAIIWLVQSFIGGGPVIIGR